MPSVERVAAVRSGTHDGTSRWPRAGSPERKHTFIGSERGDAVLVYDFDDEAAPQLVQVLPTGEAPEGLLAVQRRHLFLTSNEDDGTISILCRR